MSRRTTFAGIGLLSLVALVFTIWWTGPHGPIPGGPLAGERIDRPPENWHAASQQQYVLVESRAGWLPHSSGAMAQVHDGQLYLILPSLFGDGLHHRLKQDPDLSIAVEGRVHAVSTEPVTDAASLGAMMPDFLWKFFALRIDPGDVAKISTTRGVEFSGAEAWIYRVTPRE